MKEIFTTDMFWVSFIIVTVVSLIVAGMNIDTYLKNQELNMKIKAGLQECMVQKPGTKTQILWQKECSKNIIFPKDIKEQDNEK
jgi:hypothetical protein